MARGAVARDVARRAVVHRGRPGQADLGGVAPAALDVARRRGHVAGIPGGVAGGAGDGGAGRALLLAGVAVLVVREPAGRAGRLPCVPLVIRSKEEVTVMPPADRVLREEDGILFCGTDRGRHLLDATLNNAYTLNYLMSGVDEPRGYVMQWLMRRGRFTRAQA